MTKQNKTIFAGLIMIATILSVSATYSTAFAQESDVERDKPNQPYTLLGGAGAAVGEDDQGWRSHFRIAMVESQNDDPDAHTEYEIKRGMFIVGKYDNRHYYSVIPDTWEVSVSPNEKSFDASGIVENKEGKTFDVQITGDKISDLQNGSLYYVTGTAVGDDGEEYELFYISAIKERNPSTTDSGTQ